MSYGRKSLYLDVDKLPQVAKRFSLGRVLNNGMTSKVYQGVDRENNHKQVAIKVLSKLAENIEVVEEEYRIFKDLSRHDTFPEFYGAFLNKHDKSDKDEVWLVLEYCAGGSLADLVVSMAKNKEFLPEPVIAYILKQITSAVAYLHINHIMHRDIKARNVLLTADGQVKLADFGFCRHLKHTMSVRKTTIGSPHWMAPELITGRRPGENDEGGNSEISQCQPGYTNTVDVWSIGITAIEIADAEPPLWNIHPVRALFQIVNNPPPELKKPLDWSANFREFLSECLIKNPAQRPVAQELVEHPFLVELPEGTTVESLKKQLGALIIKTAKPVENLPEMIYKQGQLQEQVNGPYVHLFPDDLAGLDEVTEDKIAHAVGNRFNQGSFHTYAGDVLLIVNPNSETGLYEQKFHDKYKLRARSDEAPHIFAVADRAWQDMLHHKVHQNILLAGDRNSGKSFNFVQLIRHFCNFAKGNPMASKRIEQLPFFLDSFGNAATDINSNSSRHCRYIDLCFTGSGKLCGAIVSIYLLEKWRICSELNKSNRNFHVFYYIYYGLKREKELKKYCMDGQSNFRYMPLGGTSAEESFYLQGYHKLKEYLKDWDMEGKEREFIFETVAGILMLGELEFEFDKVVSVKNHHTLAKVAALLKVNQARLSYKLCNTNADETGVSYSSPIAQAEFARDALARGLYSRLFDWLVNTLNTTMCIGRKIFGEKFTIGILDPPGFDTANKSMPLEQMFNNITNEQMAYHYCQSIFVAELEECAEEGVVAKNFKFNDNREAMNAMLAKPDGLLALVDDHSRARDTMNQLNGSLKQSMSPKYVTTQKDAFTINHFAGNVSYKMADFYVKNRDYLDVDLIEVMRESSDPHMAAIFVNKKTKTGHVITTDTGPPPKKHEKVKSKGFNTPSAGAYSQRTEMQTLATQTRHTLIQLLKKCARGDPHFVRCFNRGTASGLDKKALVEQMRSFNVVETVAIRKMGFTHRIPFAEFLRRYQFLAFDFEETVDMTGDNCRLLLLRLKVEGWKLGKSKVFIKYYAEEFLSRMYESQVRKIVKIQAVLRAVMAKLHKKRGILKPGAKGASKPAKKAADMSEEQAATAIQSNFRGFKARKEMGIQKKNGKEDPSKAKKVAPKRKEPMTEKEAARIIQYYWKKWKKNSVFQQLLFCRAEKQQQLTYFCQQIHIYNQEYAGNVRKSAKEVKETSSVFIEPRRPFSIPIQKRLLKKMPLLMRNRHFLDTTFMCVDKVDRSQIDGRRGNNRAYAGYGYDQESVVRPSTYQRNPTAKPGNRANVVKSEYNKYDPGEVSSSVKARASEMNTKPTQPSNAAPKSAAPKKPFVPKNVANAPGHSNIAREIEQKAAQYGKTDDDEASAPFNFQGMLRKTNNTRGSMKRPVSDGNVPNFNQPSSVVYNSKKSFKKHSAPAPPRALSPTQHEIAPGLILDGDCADL